MKRRACRCLSGRLFHRLVSTARADIDPLRVQSALLAKRVARYDDPEVKLYIAGLLLINTIFVLLIQLYSFKGKNPARLEIRVLTLLGWLWKNDIHAVAAAHSELWSGIEDSILLQLCKADFKSRPFNEVESLLYFSDCICPEMAMLQASLLSKRGDYLAAINLLLSFQCPRHIRYYCQLIGHMIDGKDSKNVMACAHQALSEFGEHPQILHHFTTLNLYKA